MHQDAKAVMFLAIFSTCVLSAHANTPHKAPYKHVFSKNEAGASGAIPCEEGPHGIRLMPQSDLFPNDVTPEMAQIIIKEYTAIARKLKMLEDPESEDRPSEMLVLGKPGVGKTTIAAAIA